MSSESKPQQPLRLSIIGGGPGGLTLARILQVTSSPSDLQISVYERDSSRSARSQGGSLDLHVDTGLRALRMGGLIEGFKKLARPEGDVMRFYDMFGVLRHDEEPVDLSKVDRDADVTGHPEIDRAELRDLLIDSLNPSTIQWNHQLASLKPLPTREYELTFTSGKKVTTDLVVGADGTWSLIRPLLNPQANPIYTGLCAFDFVITDADTRFPDLSKRTGDGSAIFLGGKKSVMVQRNGHGKIRVYANLWRGEEWIDQFKGLEAKVVKEKILKEFEGYDDKVLDYIRAADDEILLRNHRAIPSSNYDYSPNTSLALLGDAAHVMSPFAGEGVNLAMADAADLASLVSKFLTERAKPDARAILEGLLKGYYKDMFERALVANTESAENLKGFHSEDAVAYYLNKFGGAEK